MCRGRTSAAERVEQIVVSRATHRQPRGARKLIVQSSHDLVYPGGKVHVDVERRIWTVIAVGLRLPLVFITAEEVHAVLNYRTAEGSAQLLIRIREYPLDHKIRSIEGV